QDLAGVTLEYADRLAAGRVPDPHRLVRRGAGQALAVGAEGHAIDIAGVAFEGEDLPAAGRIPDPHLSWPTNLRPVGLPAGAGQEAAVGAEGHPMDPVVVACEGEELLAAGRVPDPYRPVMGGAGQAPAVGAEGHATDQAG